MLETDPTLQDAASVSGRDLRIDLLRGLALLMVWVDHFEDAVGIAVFSPWTLRAWGPSDAAELFVLLSGLVVGRAYSNRLTRNGFRPAFVHALWRTVMLYVGYALAGVILIWSSRFLELRHHPHLLARDASSDDALGMVLRLLSLQSAPSPLQILLLYLAWLPVSPFLVACLRRRFWPTLMVSAGMYLYVQPFWHSSRPDFVVTGWYFRPWGWQLLYIIGLAGGVRWQRKGVTSDQSIKCETRFLWRRTIAVAAVLVVGYFLRQHLSGDQSGRPAGPSIPLHNLLVSLSSKSPLGPIRLVHAVAVTSLILSLLPGPWRTSLPNGLHFVGLCGRNSLLIYAVGVAVLPVCLWLSNSLGPTSVTVLLIEFNALIGFFVIAGFARALANRTLPIIHR